MTLINDDNFEFVFGSTPPPGQSSQDFNLPPEGSPQTSCVGGEPHGQHKEVKPKPWDLNNPYDYQEALDAVLQQIEDQKNAAENTRKQADKELGRPSSPYIREQDILDCIEKGKLRREGNR